MRNRSTIDNDEWVRYMCNMSQTPRRTCILLFRLIGIVDKYAVREEEKLISLRLQSTWSTRTKIENKSEKDNVYLIYTYNVYKRSSIMFCFCDVVIH